MTETWVAEEELELWEIRQFGEKLEKQRASVQEKLAIQGPTGQTVVVTTSTTGLSQTASQIKAQMEMQLKQQRLALQQKRLQENQGIKLTTTASITSPVGGTTIIVNSTPGSSTPQLRTISISTPGALGGSTPTIIKQVQPKTIVTSTTGLPGSIMGSALAGSPLRPGLKVQLPGTTISIRPSSTLTLAPKPGTTPTAITVSTTPTTATPRLISPQQALQVPKSAMQIKPQVPTPGVTGQVQNLQIIQGPGGQLQVRGLLPGQQIVRLPDGRLQLITMPSQAAAQTACSSSAATPAPTPSPTTAITQQQTLVRPAITLRPQQPALVVSTPSTSPSQPTVTPGNQTRLIVPAQMAPGSTMSMSAVAGSSTITLPTRPSANVLGIAGSSPQKPLIISTGRMPGILAATSGTPGAATQQLVSLAGQQVVSTPLMQAGTLVTSQAPTASVVSISPTATGLPVMSIRSATVTSPTQPPTPAVVALQSSQGTTSLLSGQSLLARPLSSASATSLLGMALPTTGGTLTLGGQRVAHIIQTAGAPNTMGTTMVTATPASAGTLASLAPQLQLKTVGGTTVAAVKTPVSPIRHVIAPVQVKTPGAVAGSPQKTTVLPLAIKTVQSLPTQLTLPGSATQPAIRFITTSATTPTIITTTTSTPVTTPPSATAAGSTTTTSPSATGKYAITPQVVQQVVRQALMQNQTPEIQAKLLAMQRQIQQQQHHHQQPQQHAIVKSVLTTPTKPLTTSPGASPSDGARVKKPLTQEQKDDQMRSAVCGLVIKSMLDKIEREEKLEQKRQKKQESAEERQKRLNTATLQRALFKHKEALKKEILKKRSLMEKSLQQEIFVEMAETIKRQKKSASAKVGTASNTSPVAAVQQSASATPVMLVKKRDGEPPKITAYTPGIGDTTRPDSAKSAVKKRKSPAQLPPFSKQKVITIGSGKARPEKLYCVCRTPYDQTRFYIGCDLCSNWFHGTCVNITEEQARFIDSYICEDCRKQQENTSEELYCLCRTPYDENQFYIGCDRCQDWFHGRCVGISKTEADSIDMYICPNCQQKEQANPIAQKELTQEDYVNLLKITRSLQAHKMSWPFRTAVDPKEVPDYYKVVKEPMDLSIVELRVVNKFYATLSDYVKDVTKIFDNCRLYNPTDSPFYQCAEVLETFFVQKLKSTREQSK